MPALLAYTHDAHLATRSGYHVIAAYLPQCPQTVAPRLDPVSPIARLRTRVRRRFAFSRWCMGGSFEVEDEIRARIQAGYAGPVHFLWCDRDLGSLDRELDPATHPLIGTFHQCVGVLPEAIRRVASLPRFAAIIIMSETQRAWFASQGVKPDRVHRLLHGVDVDYFMPAIERTGERFTVLAVGGTQRNFSLLREVAASLPDVAFEIVGPSDKRAIFEGMTNLEFHHRLTDEQLLSRYQQASCLLHLITDSTANNVINEALACGTPVISERHGGVPEYVTPECAILCPHQSGAAVVDAIKALAASRMRQDEMRLAARAHALTLDWRLIAAQTEELYQSLS